MSKIARAIGLALLGLLASGECWAGGEPDHPRALGPDPNWQMLVKDARSLEGLTIGPDDQNRREALIHGVLMLGRRDEALTEAGLYLRLHPNSPQAHCVAVHTVRCLGDEFGAMRLVQKAVQRFPRELAVANMVAWMLATSPMATLRDGPRAVRIAQAVCEANGWVSAPYIDTLAAAEAAAGNYPRAVELQQRVLKMGFGPRRPPHLRAQAEERLACFRRGERWHFRRPVSMP